MAIGDLQEAYSVRGVGRFSHVALTIRGHVAGRSGRGNRRHFEVSCEQRNANGANAKRVGARITNRLSRNDSLEAYRASGWSGKKEVSKRESREELGDAAWSGVVPVAQKVRCPSDAVSAGDHQLLCRPAVLRRRCAAHTAHAPRTPQTARDAGSGIGSVQTVPVNRRLVSKML